MSSPQGNEFGSEHHEKYAKVLETWSEKNLSDPTEKQIAQWGSDLQEALAEDVITSLIAKQAVGQWSKQGLTLPSKDVLRMFSQIAVKYSLGYASTDLLRRLTRSVKENRANPALTADASGEIRVMRPSELISRAPQTVAQMYDMAKDQFNTLLNRHLTKREQLTGKKRWVTVGEHSRHANLNNEVRDQDESFTYKKKSIEGPRPVGGNPADWSNCSCRIQYQRRDKKWIDVTD